MYFLVQALAALWAVVILGSVCFLLAGYIGCLVWAICRRRRRLALAMAASLALALLLLFLGHWTNELFVCAFAILLPLAYWRRAWATWLLPMGALSVAFFLGGFWMISSLLMFNHITEQATNELATQMRREQGAGISSTQFLAHFGKPATGHTEAMVGVWYYNANPWYMFGWSQIAVRVDQGKITGVALDD